MANAPQKEPQKEREKTQDRGFKDIPRERMLELARQVAEIQRYQVDF